MDMWNAGVYLLLTSIAVFSLVWPHIKILFIFIAFVFPTSLLNKRKREVFLMILDATGKWVFFDKYILIFMIFTFHYTVEFPVVEPSEAEKGSILNIFVYLYLGFYGTIIGIIISLILSHIIIHLHRSLDEHPEQYKGKKAESYIALISFAKNKYLGKIIFRVLISILLFFTLGLVIIGSFTTSFSFHYYGLVKYPLDLLDMIPYREFSLIDIGSFLPEYYEYPNNIILRFTQIIYFLTVFLMPMAMLINILFLWFIPLSRRAQKYFYLIAEILNAWSCLDVFVISMIITIIQISQFAAYIVEDKFGLFTPFVSKYLDKTLDGHATCYEVQAKLHSGCLILIIAAIMFFISSNVVMKICRNALDERLPDKVKELLINEKDEEKNNIIISLNNNISDKDNNAERETLLNNENSIVSNINNSKRNTKNNDIVEIED